MRTFILVYWDKKKGRRPEDSLLPPAPQPKWNPLTKKKKGGKKTK